MVNSTIGTDANILFPTAVRIIEFRAPESVPHHPDATVEIFCHTEGDPAWQINGSLAGFSTLFDLLNNRGFTFQSVSLPSSPPQYKLNMTVEVAGNNNTDIRCVAISSNPGEPGVASRTATILVAGISCMQLNSYSRDIISY